MNAAKASYIENQFGPPSEPVNLAHFVQSTSTVPPLGSYPPEVAEQCSVANIRDSLTAIGNDPISMAFLIRSHDLAVANLLTVAEKGGRIRKKPPPRENSTDTAEFVKFQAEIDNILLESWKLPPNSAIFIRSVKNSDQNTLIQTKTTTDGGRILVEAPQAIITVTVHNKLSWRQSQVARSSTHSILSSQTLGDLFEMMPCTSNELFEEIVDDGRVTGYLDKSSDRSGCVICIEGLAYGDGESESDYAIKLIQHLQDIPKETNPGLTKAPTAMHDTPLSSLSLRIGEPYWLLHQGNCEHFIVVDQIRMQHPSDPISGYPLTLQITPPLLDSCRGCTKTTAIWSIVGDERLGESPCFLCGPCWDSMGSNPNNDSVLVVPFPKYELGW